MNQTLITIIISFTLSMAIAPFIIKLMKGRAGQPILGYVDNHYKKKGCPTMGGIIFVLPVAVLTLIMGGEGITMGKYAALILLGYAVIGFLDDFIKVHYQENKGLKAYQKIIAQLAIAIIVSVYAYNNEFISTSIVIPFSSYRLELGPLYIPLIIFIFIASTNSVNLTDGLDGLASSVSVIFFGAFTVIILGLLSAASYLGDVFLVREYQSLAIYSAALVGSLLGFLWFNSSPAKIIMGDTGALALGGAVATVAVFTNNPILILIIGIMYVISSISVIIQVLYFKVTKGKRIFLMAPFHHHLEYKGIKEWKIVSYYTIITILMSLLAFMSLK